MCEIWHKISRRVRASRIDFVRRNVFPKLTTHNVNIETRTNVWLFFSFRKEIRENLQSDAGLFTDLDFISLLFYRLFHIFAERQCLKKSIKVIIAQSSQLRGLTVLSKFLEGEFHAKRVQSGRIFTQSDFENTVTQV